MDAIEHLMRALLPGGAGFPAADATAARLLAERLHHAGIALPEFATSGTWTEHAAALERDDPKLFNEFRKYAYLTYYEQPGVIAAIRALGHPYNDSPLPDGYPGATFVPERDAPRAPRGYWRETPP